jgi:hypothetical protein
VAARLDEVKEPRLACLKLLHRQPPLKEFISPRRGAISPIRPDELTQECAIEFAAEQGYDLTREASRRVVQARREEDVVGEIAS